MTAANADAGVVDRADIAEQFASARFTAPLVEARPFWQATYDVDAASVYGDPVNITGIAPTLVCQLRARPCRPARVRGQVAG